MGVYAVCVSPSMIDIAAPRCPAGLHLAAVAGFPSGKHVSEVKAREAGLAVAAGAAEIDMVIDVGAALAGDISAVRDDIALVRKAIPGAVKAALALPPPVQLPPGAAPPAAPQQPAPGAQ